jgi:hypothetical protein
VIIEAALDRPARNLPAAARALRPARRCLELKPRRLGLDSRAEVDTQ